MQRVNTGSMLEQLHRARRTRSIASAVLVVGLVAVLLLGGGMLARQDDAANSGATPGSHPTSTPSTASSPSDSCSDGQVTCLGSGRYRFALGAPVTITLPDNFGDDFSVDQPGMLEMYRNDLETTGVSIMENPTPVRNDGSWSRDATAGDTAKSVARWLAKRPFLTNTHVIRTNVGGLPAWRVTGTLKPHAKLAARKDSQMVAPTFTLGAPKAAYWPEIVGEYTLVDVPTSGVTVIWSWALNQHLRVLKDNQALIDTLSFGP